MSATTRDEMMQLVEELRSSGYRGRDLAISTAHPDLGTCITAIRQLEALVSQMASACLDGDMDAVELSELINASFAPRIASLAEIIDATIERHVAEQEPLPQWYAEWAGSHVFYGAWRGVQFLIDRIDQKFGTINFELIVFLLVAVVALRQWVERAFAQNGGSAVFSAGSSNVAPRMSRLIFLRVVSTNWAIAPFLIPIVIRLPRSCAKFKNCGRGGHPGRSGVHHVPTPFQRFNRRLMRSHGAK
jgi:hypothetical protein